MLGPLERAIPVIRLALSKGPSRVGVSFTSPEDVNRSSFRNDLFSSYLQGQGPQVILIVHKKKKKKNSMV
jgi:hypothetical protein